MLKELQLHTQSSPDTLAQAFYVLFYTHNLGPHFLPSYPLEPNESTTWDIISPFNMSELLSALHNLSRSTTPGTDGIAYSMLRNLPDTYLGFLSTRINEAWDTGTPPPPQRGKRHS